jgi:Cdc6-like AAA superfamily ATPase
MSEYAGKYGLREENFQIQPDRDRSVFYGKENLASSIVNDLKRKLLVGRPVKAVLYGDIGVGKTQLLRYISFQLANEVYSVYIKCPAYHRRTSYVAGFHSVVFSELGSDFIFELLGKAIGGLAAQPLGIPLRKRELERVIRNGWTGDRNALRKFLSGAVLTSSEMRSIGAIRQQLNEDEAVEVLNMISELTEKVTGKKLLLLVDEFENTNVLRGDPMTMFTEAIREIVEESNRVNVLFAATVRSIEENRILNNPSIRSRIGHLNYHEIGEYTEEEIRSLIGSVIRYKRSPDFDVGRAISKLSAATKERLDIQWFPFTVEAIDELVEGLKLLRDDGIIPLLRPRETLELMDRSLSIAVEMKSDVIDSEAVRSAIGPR